MLNLDSLPGSTRKLFEFLAQMKELETFSLIGGTALALQIGHRRSEDLDFWLPSNRLNKRLISHVVREAERAGFPSQLATPHHQIVAAKINGTDILEYAQDYVIGGAKVTFFARDDVPYQHFDTMQRLPNSPTTFQIMGEEGLFAMKSYVIHQRTRSRDLYDLKSFMERGKDIESILYAGAKADPACSIEYAKSVLIGDVPLDKADEGFDSIGVTEKISDIYAFFSDSLNSYEEHLAAEIARSIRI